MSEHFNDPSSQDYLIGTSFIVGMTEFDVFVGHNGISYWIDENARYEEIQRDPSMVFGSIAGIEECRKKYINYEEEFTIEAPVPEEDLEKIKYDLSPKYWNDQTDKHTDEELDKILEPIFWNHINPYLPNPLKK